MVSVMEAPEALKRIAQEDKSYYLILSQRRVATGERQDTDDQAAAFELELPQQSPCRPILRKNLRSKIKRSR